MSTGLRKLKTVILVIGDLAAAYLALFAALFIRYGGRDFGQHLDQHLRPFTLIFALWLLILYVVGLYDMGRARSRIDLVTRVVEGIVASFLISLAVFYFATDYNITPKTNLALTIAIFAALFVGWRLLALTAFARVRFRGRLLFLGRAPETDEICSVLKATPYLGWECAGVISEVPADGRLPEADAIVVSRDDGRMPSLTGALYERFFAATSIVDFADFYESVRRAVPASALSEEWVLKNLAGRDIAVYDQLKRPLDFILSALLLIPALPIMAAVALLVRISGPGPILYRQERVGKGGRTFTIIKFRSMRPDAEVAGATFASENDPRVTGIGRFLRRTRLDELPQLWNILRGDMSFVGPRPERPEFERQISAAVPLFPVRHVVRPGLTGWAQVNDSYAASTDDHLRKLRLDLYYLKHRSPALDVAILLRTAYSVLKRRGR